MINLIELGSQTAKNGFRNERDIVEKFLNWETDYDSRFWLKLMGYALDEIEFVNAYVVSGEKADIQVQITVKLIHIIDCQNIQVKLVSNPRGFNQIDKRWLARYRELWNIPPHVLDILMKYTGETSPNISNPRDRRRMFADEFSDQEKYYVISWLTNNKSLIISDILKGRGSLSAEWMLVARKVDENTHWILKPMNFCIQYFSQGDVEISARGNFKIGRITMQRKGGDGGRNTANMLQFKINPAELFLS